MTVTSPYVQAAEALAAILDAEFNDLGVQTQHDNLHESLGYNGLVVGVAPDNETPQSRDMLVQDTVIRVKFYDYWVKEVDNTQAVDPRDIAVKAERFRRAVQAQQQSGSGSPFVWFFDVISVTYPNDPTGNKSRFEAVVRARGQNSGITETSG